MWLWFLVGCSGGGCEELAAGVERDACSYAAVLASPADQADQVLARVQTIADPIVRGTAVTRWVGQHARTLDPVVGRQLCETLDGPDQGQCLRRLQSAHLQR